MFHAVLTINIQIFDAYGLVVLSKFNVIKISAFLIHVVHHYKIVYHLQLVQVF